jgi:toxin HigB-1
LEAQVGIEPTSEGFADLSGLQEINSLSEGVPAASASQVTNLCRIVFRSVPRARITYSSRETEKNFRREHSRRFGSIQRVAMRRLYSLDAARKLTDLASGGMSLEALKGDRKGQHSIRIDDQFRICFVWAEGNVTHVEIVDYH